jgi:formate/nitrite transporter
MDDRAGLEIGELMNAFTAKRDRQSLFALVLFGILAGVYIGFGAMAATTARSFTDIPVGAARFLGASLFCVGLILVVIPGSELFTGNVLMTASLIHRKISLFGVLRNWTCVWIANFLGSLLLALVVFGTGLLGSPDSPSAVGKAAIDVTKLKIGLSFSQALLSGILCNMLVCLAVILTLSARTTMGKILGIYFPITTFVFCGFEHSIANMFFLPAGLLAQGKLLSDFWSMFPNLIPVTIGNVIGGTLVVVLHPARAGRIWSMLRPHRNNSD